MVRSSEKCFNNRSLTVRVAEWLERRAGKRGVIGLIPGGGIYFLCPRNEIQGHLVFVLSVCDSVENKL